MSSRRDEMLKEMGLAPVWRLREPDSRSSFDELRTNGQHERAIAGERLPVRPERNAAESKDEPAAVAAQASAVPAPGDDRRATIMRMDWPALKEAVAQCRACGLHARRTNTVFGVGDENADWMFIGEAPGADEDLKGEPFVGQAGRLLDSMLAAIDLKRGQNVYILNILKCRPPGNRNPEPEEALKCDPFLQRQIDLVRPKLIVALGRVAVVNLLGRDTSIASLRGKVLDYKGIPLIVTYHPAYLLRSLTEKAKAWEDLCFAVRTMQALQSGAAAST
ncbi:MAG TPA: uracil-DNA glycosylase [Burkholderiales bacterium]|nr:uracil-DNA glycosylase [Burkholderiales bacterium]